MVVVGSRTGKCQDLHLPDQAECQRGLHQQQKHIAMHEDEMQSIRAAKSALRKQVAQRLRDLTPASVAAQSENVVKRVVQLEQYRNAERISIFLSMPAKEVQTRNIVLDALGSGKRVFVPYFERGNPDMRMFGLRDINDLESLQRDKWGIPSMTSGSLMERESGEKAIDVLFMPAVAFNTGTLSRLGHGKGYYDRFLSTYADRNDGETPLLGTVPLLLRCRISSLLCAAVFRVSLAARGLRETHSY